MATPVNHIHGMVLVGPDQTFRIAPLVDYEGAAEEAAYWLRDERGQGPSSVSSEDRDSLLLDLDLPGLRLPRFNYRPRPALKFNQLYWPTGASRYGEINLLVTGKDFAIITQEAWGLSSGDYPDDRQQVPKALWPKHRTQPLTLELHYANIAKPHTHAIQLYLADARAVIPRRHLRPLSSMERDAQLYALRLVDRRYFWQHTAFGGMPSGIDSGSPPTSPPDASFPVRALGSGWDWPTWGTLITALLNQVGVVKTVTIDARHGSPDPVLWNRPFESIGLLLDAAAASLASRWVYTEAGELQLLEADDNADVLWNDTTLAKQLRSLTHGGGVTPGPRAQYLLFAFPRNIDGHLANPLHRWWWAMARRDFYADTSPSALTIVDEACMDWTAGSFQNLLAGGQERTVQTVYASPFAYFSDPTTTCPDNISFLRDFARLQAWQRFCWQAYQVGTWVFVDDLVYPRLSGQTDYVLYDLTAEYEQPQELTVTPDDTDSEGKVTASGKATLRRVWEHRTGMTIRTHDEDFGANYSLAQDPTVPLITEAVFLVPPTGAGAAVLFEPGDTKTVVWAEYRGAPYDHWYPRTTPETEVTLYDPEYHCCAMSMHDTPTRYGLEPIRAVWSDKRERWEVAHPQGLRRPALTLGTIFAGFTGSVEIYDAGSPTGLQVTAYLDWMDGGAALSAGKEILIEYFPNERRWRIVGAEC